MITLPPNTSESPLQKVRSFPQRDFALRVLEIASSKETRRATVSTRPTLIAIDGRSGSGKSTLGKHLSEEVAAILGSETTLLGTDDFAWNAPMFGWAEEAAENVLRPLREGKDIKFTPAAWQQHGRTGEISVPSGCKVIVLEGIGSSQVAFDDLIDVRIWVQSDSLVAKELGIARDLASGVNGNREETEAFWDAWDAEELVYFEADQPWNRADVLVLGNSGQMPEPGMVRATFIA